MADIQNTHIVTDETLDVLTHPQRLQLGDVAAATGFSIETMTRRGAELFLIQEAPVYMERAKQAQGQQL